jgi:hypothetical protein
VAFELHRGPGMTALLVTLILSAAPAVGLNAEEAAQRLIAPQTATAPRLVTSDFQYRARLMSEKTRLVATKPDLSGPVTMLGVSTGVAALAGLAWWGFAMLGGLSGGGFDMVLLTLPLMVIAIALTGGFAVLGAVGTILMVKNIREMQQAETRIGQIDEALRAGWPTNAPPPAPAR